MVATENFGDSCFSYKSTVAYFGRDQNQLTMAGVVALSLLACCWQYAAAQPITLHEQQQWHHFKSTYGKTYPHAEEESYRKQVFVNNLRNIDEHNKKFAEGKTKFTMEVNKFGDLTSEEFSKSVTELPARHLPRTNEVVFSKEDFQDLPESVDWREKGAVTPVKSVSACNANWAIAATGAVEGMHFLKTGELVDLSEQNLIDCSQEQGNRGCDGGTVSNAFDYIIANGGIDASKYYPYQVYEATCLFDEADIGATISNYTYVKEGSEADLMAAVAKHGPVVVHFNGLSREFFAYREGVFDWDECDPHNLNYPALVVGYGTTEYGAKYWIVKSSWSTYWGMKGYALIARDNHNMCGIASAALYPIP